jgi:hypothetical protein
MAQHKLTATGVSKTRKIGYHGDGGNLYLQVTRSGKRKISKSWIFRYRSNGKTKTGRPQTREMGLGPYPLIGLGDARERAAAARRLLFDGRDPIAARTQDRAKALTFAKCAADYIEARADEWGAQSIAIIGTRRWRTTQSR